MQHIFPVARYPISIIIWALNANRLDRNPTYHHPMDLRGTSSRCGAKSCHPEKFDPPLLHTYACCPWRLNHINVYIRHRYTAMLSFDAKLEATLARTTAYDTSARWGRFFCGTGAFAWFAPRRSSHSKRPSCPPKSVMWRELWRN